MAFIMALLLSLSIGASATAHAMEPMASINAAEAGYFGHSAGDADEVLADADKGYPHHHGTCHDHGVGVPATAGRLAMSEPSSPALLRQCDDGRPSAVSDTLRRPPRA
jgi:hypothetical protein